ncbi:PelA/Pel-15E family pectate lyase [Pseudoduganella flava]|uniref:PelA/Pel-15E family pectate lyase n=1 Tax=Pseudoduganella flava TaxID=871742 RepID=A0A562PKG8_9BURK|nr:pectate lyase [Pseudoduganella flava]TWI44975.1 PelA/Pel-15E family pectate lyase [Pseudoduganella flava]
MKRFLLSAAVTLALGVALPATATVIGTMTPAQPVTEARLAALPEAERAAWRAYLERSRMLMERDKAALAAERAAGGTTSGAAAHLKGESGMPLDRPAAWYASPQARHVADNIVSFQTPAGGWGKNVDRSGPLRQRGEHYAPVDDDPRGGVVTRTDGWSYVGTIDNDATTTELRFLARVQAALPGAAGEPYRAAFAKGVGYLLSAQYPNGGFPQVYPLQGGYHDAITFNDNALVQVTELLDTVAQRQGDYAFVPADLAQRAGVAHERAIGVILASQIRVNGVPTGWCQQHDALTLAPVGARNFEPVALSSSETSRLLTMLMRLRRPAPGVVAAVDAGIAWLKRVAVYDVEYTKNGAKNGADGRHLVPKPGNGPLWARMYDIGTMQPIFGDRDRTIHTDVNELTRERRDGYGWYGNGPATALAAYAKWSAARTAAVR